MLLDGRRVDAAGRLPGSAPDPRLAAWAARVAGPTAGESSFEDEGRLVHASPLTTADGGIAHLLLLQETPSAATGAAAWLASPWPIVLAVLVGVALVASALMLRPASAAGTVAGSAGVGADDGIRVAPRDFVLREWLADVRGCLEREAATRGLVLDLRCERSLPSELVQDPAWLGGLIVAMGREALDATTLDGVTLEVAEEQGRALCFELHAGEARLSPVAGMQEVAERIGARLESRRGGRMALVLPGALA